MDYALAITTALLVFVSPCVLPLLPVYVSYFAGVSGDAADEHEDESIDEDGKKIKAKAKRRAGRLRTLLNTLGFCVGITLFYLVIFIAASIVKYQLTGYIDQYKEKILIACGFVLILFGLKFMGYLDLPFLNKTISIKAKTDNINVINAFVLGLALSLSMRACAMGLIISNLVPMVIKGNLVDGIIVGLLFAGTLDVLFIACAMLIDQLKGMFAFIKRHYKVINMITGALMIIFGILVAFGIMEQISGLLS